MRQNGLFFGAAFMATGFAAEGAIEPSRDEISGICRKVVEWQVARPAKGGDLDWATGPFPIPDNFK